MLTATSFHGRYINVDTEGSRVKISLTPEGRQELMYADEYKALGRSWDQYFRWLDDQKLPDLFEEMLTNTDWEWVSGDVDHIWVFAIFYDHQSLLMWDPDEAIESLALRLLMNPVFFEVASGVELGWEDA